MNAVTRIFFDAILRPHRSLTPAGLLILLGAVLFISGALSLAFCLLGAWPVAGFLGMDTVILCWAFYANNRAARLYERVWLTRDALTVQRVVWRRVDRCWRFQPYWLRVTMDDPPEHSSQVMLRSHGRTLIVGSFLTPDERLEFAAALRDALRAWRRTAG